MIVGGRFWHNSGTRTEPNISKQEKTFFLLAVENYIHYRGIKKHDASFLQPASKKKKIGEPLNLHFK